MSKQLSMAQRLALYREMSFMLSRLSLSATLDDLWAAESRKGRLPRRGLAPAIDAWRRRMRAARTETPFSEALKGFLPEEELQILHMGERAGDIGKAMTCLADLNARQGNLLKPVTLGLTKAAMNIGITAAFCLFLGQMVLPSFDGIVSRDSWTGLAWAMSVAAARFPVVIPILLVILGAAVFAILFAIPRWVGRWREKVDLYAPFSWYSMARGSNFLLSLSMITNAGIAEIPALRLLKRGSSPWLRWRIMRIEQGIAAGSMSVGHALLEHQEDWPDQQLVRMMRAMAGDGDLPALIHEWQSHVTGTIERAVARIESATALLLYGVVVLGAVGLGQVLLLVFEKMGLHL